MKIKSAGRVGFLLIVASLFMVSSAYVVAISDIQSPATGSSQARADDGKKPSFISNSIMVKLTPQARANLKASGQEVNPAATGVAALDAVDRDHGAQNFTAVTEEGPYRDPTAAIILLFNVT